MADPILIVGAGQAGQAIAEALRAEGYDGPLLLTGAERHLPYHRPPLSKQFLAGDATAAQILIRGADFYDKRAITLALGRRVVATDRDARLARFADGETVRYGGLALATGARPRLPPIEGRDLDGVLCLRSLEDAESLADRIARARHVVVVGGGFIGLEVAAAARKAGRPVVVLEALPRLMARAVSPMVSDFYAALHTAHGAEIALGATVARLLGEDGRLTGVETADGRRRPADLAVIGVGVVPDDALAAAMGLACDRGIVVDACSRTSDPAIVAAGDCTARRMPDGSLLRLESVQGALEQARSAAAALLGRERPFTAAPWFWSDQYDAKLQIAGLSAGADRSVTRGAPEDGNFSVFHYGAGRLIAVETVSRPAEHMLARKLLEKGVSPSPELVADPAADLRALLR